MASNLTNQVRKHLAQGDERQLRTGDPPVGKITVDVKGEIGWS